MRILAIAVTLVLVASNAGAFNELYLKMLKTLNAFNHDGGKKDSKCDLSGADLSEADLWNANKSGASLRNTKTWDIIFCKTKTPWGVDNSGCQKAK